MLIGLLAIADYRETHSTLSAVTVAIWFWLPVVDCLRLMLTRMLEARSPFDGDRRHLHHLLLARMAHPYALVSYLALLGLPALVTEIDPMAGQLTLLGCFVLYLSIVLPRRQSARVEAISVASTISAGK